MTETKRRDNRLWRSLKCELEKKYSILQYIDFSASKSCVDRMAQDIKSSQRENYKPNEKIVVLHYDTDFYMSGPFSIGINLYNFLTIINYLGISPSVFIILTNHYGLNKELENYYKNHYSNFDIKNDWFNVLENNFIEGHSPEYDLVEHIVDHEQIAYHYSCLNGAGRTHRKVLLTALAESDLLDKGMVSWMFDQSTKNKKNTSASDEITIDSFTSNINLIKIAPHTRINDKWPVDKYFEKCLNNHLHLFDHNYQHREVYGDASDYRLSGDSRWKMYFCRRSFLQIVTETTFHYPHVYFTEKTIRNFFLKRPFIIVGNPGTLKILHELGFQTFNKFWNEDYDNELDPNKRLHKILKIIKDICSKDILEIQSMCYTMQEMLDHNFKNYTKNYKTTELKRLLNKI